MTDQPQLQKFLDHVAAGRGGTVTEYRPISGGYSRLSALATVRWADGHESGFRPSAGSCRIVTPRKTTTA